MLSLGLRALFLRSLAACSFALLSSSASLYARSGHSLYLENCARCHGAEREGLDPNPPLKNSAWVNGDPERLIRIVLNGYAGTIRVAGEEYRGQMPSWRTILNDDQVASILTYLRSESGAEKISTDQVASVRQKTKGEPTTRAPSGCMGGRTGMGRGHRHGGMGGGMGCGCGR
ncbi:cytochrome c oxidase cbb3-type subunit III [Methylacidimicrobium cyclopophantes]|uniref:Cytochrome c oxidase cbb3-type subunit III n=1 Tax=Methylacidimicrobium cyclopophantes TaxID=1041766 RepID=A0A5E6MG48_9BACT|nr:cytochrome c [Methylacidimicrobium cyclopophantes]VVM07982.1 cytochrome c oxidase cbb3-type subunit III [Methylacidimicrobium cyclopophantes]